MVFAPDQPFPKTRGHVIRSKDWNDAVTELQRLDSAKINKAGDNVTGPLTIAGNVGIGTTSPQRPLQIGTDTSGVGLQASDASPNAGYVRWGDNSGWRLHFGRSRESSGGALNTGTTGVVMTLQDNGNVGIGTTTPGGKLEIGGGGDLLLKAAAEDAGDIVFQASTGTQKGRIWSNPTPGAALFLSSGDVTPDVAIDASGNVGIGTTTPATGNKMDVAGNLRILTGSNPIRFTAAWSGFPDAATNQAEIANDTGTYKTLMIIGNRSAGLTTPGGGRRVSVWDVLEVNGILRMNAEQDILFRAGPDLNHGMGWYGPYTGGYGKAFAGQFIDGPVLYGFSGGALGTTSGGQRVSLTWNSLNRVGINRFNPQFTLHVNGLAVRQDNSSQWSVVSDLRLKQGVETLEGALDKLSRLRGVSFEWKKPEEQGNLTGTQVGLVAQEVEEVLPEWVDESPEGHKTLTIRGFEALVIEAFKELGAENETLRTKNKELEARIAALERRISGRVVGAGDVGVIDATEAAEIKARELGVRLSGVEGTGVGGRIVVRDVEKAADA